MAEKPTTAKEYSSDQSKLVRETCLYVATIIGDYMEDIVIVEGGKIRNIEEDFAAVITPGLMLAFSDRKKLSYQERQLRQRRRRGISGCAALDRL